MSVGDDSFGARVDEDEYGEKTEEEGCFDGGCDGGRCVLEVGNKEG